ncbi:autoinducer binding domain-containing protein [Pararhodobacter aggregans]|uniref:helix-turn-helix transcriptional regulator n=1 Tax=Pararhodobacter aggregans TaxID=404875 RepID=UPI003A8FEB6C
MPDVFDFPAALAQAQTPAAACTELLSWSEPHGFSIYAIGAAPHPDAPYPTQFMVTNWPQDWQSAYYDRQFGDRDPTLRAMKALGRPFTISDLRAGRCGFLPGAAEREVLDFAASLGYPEGLLVPVYRANGYRGFSVLAGNAPDPGPALRARLQFLLEHAHDRLRVLVAQQLDENALLTPREVQILSLARLGQGDADIARQAAISIRTVRFHFDNARRKLAARSRSEAIAIAVEQHLLPV